jgi:hypothetical protein
MPRLALALLATLFVAQAPSFEGRLRMRTIHLQVEEDETNATLDAATSVLAAREDAGIDSANIMVKGNIIRTEGGSGAAEGYALWDLTRNTMTLIQPSERAYMEVPMPQSSTPGRAAPARGPAPRSLGARTINGMKTTGYEIRDGDLIVRGWMTNDHPGLTWAFRNAISHQEEADEEQDFEDAATQRLSQYGWPVVLYTLRQGSLEVEEMLAVDRSPLSADLFKVPAGYTKRSLGGP